MRRMFRQARPCLSQIAHWKNARVIGADRVDGNSGADAFINTSNKNLTAEVRALTGGKGVDLALDAVGGPVFEPTLKSLRVGGRQVAITSSGSRRVEFDLLDFYHNLSRLIGVDTMKLTGLHIAKIMDSLRPGFEDGTFKPFPVRTWKLDEAVDAYGAAAKSGPPEKQVLAPLG
jgi:NADPH2:quinone reductase